MIDRLLLSEYTYGQAKWQSVYEVRKRSLHRSTRLVVAADDRTHDGLLLANRRKGPECGIRTDGRYSQRLTAVRSFVSNSGDRSLGSVLTMNSSELSNRDLSSQRFDKDFDEYACAIR